MVELIVEGYNIELDTNTVIELTYSINDIRNPISTNNAWSKQIELPGTDNNNDAFSFLYENNIEVGYNPNLKRDCEIRVDSIPIIEGYMKMDETGVIDNRIYYKVTIYGANTTIFEDMGDALLTDLDLSEYDHLYTKNAVTDSWGSTREGFYYPWVNHSDVPWVYSEPTDTGSTYFSLVVSGETYKFFPGFYVKTLVDKIFSYYGYTYDSVFFNSDLFKNLFIPFNNSTSKAENIIRLTNQVYQIWSTEYVPDPIPHYQDSSVYYRSGITETDPANLYYPYQTGWAPSIQTPSDGYWTFRVQGYSINGTGWQFKNGSFTVKSVLLNGTFPTELFRIDLVNPSTVTTRYDFSFSFSIPDKILQGRRIIVETYSRGNEHQNYKSGYVYNIDWDFDTPTPILNGTQIKASQTLPVGLKQRELLNTLILMFNLYIERDPNNIKNITIEPHSNYYSRSSNTVDWTYKVDESSRVYKLMSELNAGSYLFTYKNDTDYEVKNYKDKTNEIPGQAIKYIQSNFISNQQKIELLPSPTIIQNLADSDLLIWPSIHTELTDDNAENSGYTGTIQTKWNWRILSHNVIYDIPYGIFFNSIGWGDFHTASHIPGYTGIPLTGTSLWFDWGDSSLCWDYNNKTGITTLYQNYWEDYINLIKNQNSRLLTMDVYLTEREISNLRFYEKIFINDSWWILNRLVYSPTSRKSKAELLLIPTSDPIGLGYTGFTLTDTVLYETQTITASLNIVNESQGQETYKFYIDIMSGNTLLTEYPLTGPAPRMKTTTVSQSITMLQAGDYIIRCRNEEGYQVDIPITVSPKYYIANLIATPNPGIFNETQTISFDIVVDSDWTGTAQVGIFYIDTTFWFYKTFTGPGSQSCSKDYYSISMSTHDYLIHDLNYYIEEHLSVPTIARPTTPVATPADAVSATRFTAHANPVTNGYYWDISTDNFSTYVGGYHDFYSAVNFINVSGLTMNTEYKYRLRSFVESTWSEYSNVITVTTVPLPANLAGGAWTFVPTDPDTTQQGENLQVNWRIENTGEVDAVNQTITMDMYWEIALMNKAYDTKTLSNQTVPVGGAVFSYTYTNLPDGSGSDIYAPADLFLNGKIGAISDTPVYEGKFPFQVQPCVDSGNVSNVSITTNPITGNTSQGISFRLNNTCCHDFPYGTYGVRVRYYSDNGSTSVTTHNLDVSNSITAGSYRTFSDSYTLPNNWSNGTKKIGIEISLNYGDYTEMGSATFDYYQSVPSIHVESVDINVDTFGTVSATVTGHNVGSGSGNATPWFKITYPDNSVVNVTGTTYLITAGNTHPFDVAYSETGGNGTYYLEAGLYYGGESYGSATDSCAEERWVNIYLYQLGDEAQLRWDGYTDGRSKTISVTFGMTGETYVECNFEQCTPVYQGNADITVDTRGISVSSSCSGSMYEIDDMTFVVEGIVLNGSAGTTSVHTISSNSWASFGQCGGAYARCELAITHVDVTSGDWGVTQGNNCFSKINDVVTISHQ